MTNLYCPNCHRQLHEIDVKFGVCSMCCTPLKISEDKKDSTEPIFEKIGAEMTDKGFLQMCRDIVWQYAGEHLDITDRTPFYEVYVVWYCKSLQNWKALLSTTLNDGMYYELTLNGDKQELYLDAYKKFENKCIPLK